ncbi:hypothetical protein CCAL13119_06610 [Campylobacter sp. RM13119]|uniref:Uncharacterized protein n=1 Tax=Campylobacter californiensis TaxID=1032243 RepID=A0ABD4JJ72_9BACT|nr:MULTISPECIES: hypothetical protein [unclassified Campylobacter]MBE2986793.1 hypothetical protein [Campylobacter sp. RM12919]MBE2988529.1 hypothetical protein [Campylobacter sp. RM12920]MBE3021650.1 hypothetical protein [Campylobacter sp. 7477a]MBE3606622.1 hypothetical protein [Campylobacter sp. RM13119]MBE3610174.1 hypothetical protein [Campylobacter sp. RM12916]
MCKIWNFIFSWGFFVFALVLGVALWFAIDYAEAYRLESALVDWGMIAMMACVFGIVFYAIIAVFAIPLKGRCKCSAN